MLSIWVYFIFIHTIIFRIFLSWCSTNFAYPFISINIWSFWYYSLTCFFGYSFLVFVRSSIRWWERPLRDLCSLASIHGWWLGDIIGKIHDYKIYFRLSQMFGVNSRSYPTSISTIMLCKGQELLFLLSSLDKLFPFVQWFYACPSSQYFS
jgi:hypothetical protein